MTKRSTRNRNGSSRGNGTPSDDTSPPRAGPLPLPGWSDLSRGTVVHLADEVDDTLWQGHLWGPFEPLLRGPVATEFNRLARAKNDGRKDPPGASHDVHPLDVGPFDHPRCPPVLKP